LWYPREEEESDMERRELFSRARKKYREKIGESARTLRRRHSAPPGRCPCLLAFLLEALTKAILTNVLILWKVFASMSPALSKVDGS